VEPLTVVVGFDVGEQLAAAAGTPLPRRIYVWQDGKGL